MSDFVMPSLGADMEHGTFIEWLVKPGDRVERGQVICVVETQKGAVDVEVWASGTVERLIAEAGQTIPVGGVMAIIATDGEARGPEAMGGRGKAERAHEAEMARKPEPEPERRPRAEISVEPAEWAWPTAAKPAPEPVPAAEVRQEPTATPARGEARVKISPAARRRAAELGIDAAELVPSGAGDVVTLGDVEKLAAERVAARTPLVSERVAARPSPVAPADDAQKRNAAMREAIAAAMTRSNRDIPHYYLGTVLNAEPALAWLEKRNAGLPVTERALFAVTQLRAVALALRDVPALNGWCVNGEFQAAPSIKLGVAIGLRGGGLVAPALRDADRLSLSDMSAALRDLLSRARTGQLRSSELTDTTITITNLGDLGVETVYGVIYPPQVALVGFGRVVERPWAENGKVVVARTLHATLAADHRVTDGAVGARFLSRLAEYLQQPETLWAP